MTGEEKIEFLKKIREKVSDDVSLIPLILTTCQCGMNDFIDREKRKRDILARLSINSLMLLYNRRPKLDLVPFMIAPCYHQFPNGTL